MKIYFFQGLTRLYCYKGALTEQGQYIWSQDVTEEKWRGHDCRRGHCNWKTWSRKADMIRTGQGWSDHRVRDSTAPFTPASCRSPDVTGPSLMTRRNTGSRRWAQWWHPWPPAAPVAVWNPSGPTAPGAAGLGLSGLSAAGTSAQTWLQTVASRSPSQEVRVATDEDFKTQREILILSNVFKLVIENQNLGRFGVKFVG